MERDDMVKRLKDLAQLDVDAVEAYEQAMKQIEYDDIRQKLADFQNDHRNHVSILSRVLRDYNTEPPTGPDLKGYLIAGFTALRSITGTKGALEAMETNEKLTNKKYGEAVGWDLPLEVKKVVESGLVDEQRHLAYIQQELTTPRKEL